MNEPVLLQVGVLHHGRRFTPSGTGSGQDDAEVVGKRRIFKNWRDVRDVAR